jgi:hypothetical protein
MLEKISGIDLAIVGGSSPDELAKCGAKKESEPVSETLNGAVVLTARNMGKALGYAKFELDSNDNSVVGTETGQILLAMDMPLDPGLERITGSDIYTTAMAEIRKKVEKINQQMREEISRLQKMSPEEYLKYITEEKNSNSKRNH